MKKDIRRRFLGQDTCPVTFIENAIDGFVPADGVKKMLEIDAAF
jgi:hypothetical protein